MPLPGGHLLLLLPLLLSLPPGQVTEGQQPSTGGRSFEFQRSADLLDPNNWATGSVPCPRDTARLPRTSGGAHPPLVGLAGPLTVRDLRLPDDGAPLGIVLLDGAELRAFDERSASGSGCPPGARIRDVAFNLTKPLDWFLPEHWRWRVDNSETTVFDALPVDSLPGQCDSVRFRGSSVHWVRVLGPTEAIPVGQLEFAGRTFNGGRTIDSFETYWRASEYVGAQFFRGNEGSTTPQAAEPPLSVGSGGVEGRDCDMPLPVAIPSLMPRVCGGVGGGGCPLPLCRRPISASSAVTGACCDICGVVAKLRGLSSAGLGRLRGELAKTVKRMGAAGRGLRLSAFRVSVRGEPAIQVVVSSDDADLATDAVETVAQWLESSAASMQYTVISITRSYTGPEAYGLSSSERNSGLAAGMTVLILLAVIATVFIAVIGSRKGWWRGGLDLRGAWLARLQRRPQILCEEPASSSLQQPPVFEPPVTGAVSFTSSSQTLSMAFINPAYDVSQPQLDIPGEEADREM